MNEPKELKRLKIATEGALRMNVGTYRIEKAFDVVKIDNNIKQEIECFIKNLTANSTDDAIAILKKKMKSIDGSLIFDYNKSKLLYVVFGIFAMKTMNALKNIMNYY